MTDEQASQAGLVPIEKDDLSESTKEMLGEWAYNLHRTLAYSPESLEKWMPFAFHILQENKLSVRDREIAILRVGWNCKSPYEWGMHERVARSVGFTDDDLEAICVGDKSENWSASEAAIIATVDDIHADSTISDATWRRLKPHFEPDELVDMVYVIGQFNLISVMLNSMRTPLEDGIAPLPDNQPHFTRA